MNTYRIIVAYDGTAYQGWQPQPHGMTIADTLSRAFKAVFHYDIHLIGASRTDAGVHALGQVACFSSALHLDPHLMGDCWNRRIPKDIMVRSLEVADSFFHPQGNVQQKIYYYHFFLQRPLPFAARYGWHVDHRLDIEKLRECLSSFVGAHDFRSFCTGNDHESTIRTIDALSLVYIPRWRIYRIIIKGPGFLRYMIRRIVGASVLIASSLRDPNELKLILAERNPEQQLFTAPAHGLMLRKIMYNSLLKND